MLGVLALRQALKETTVQTVVLAHWQQLTVVAVVEDERPPLLVATEPMAALEAVVVQITTVTQAEVPQEELDQVLTGMVTLEEVTESGQLGVVLAEVLAGLEVHQRLAVQDGRFMVLPMLGAVALAIKAAVTQAPQVVEAVIGTAVVLALRQQQRTQVLVEVLAATLALVKTLTAGRVL